MKHLKTVTLLGLSILLLSIACSKKDPSESPPDILNSVTFRMGLVDRDTNNLLWCPPGPVDYLDSVHLLEVDSNLVYLKKNRCSPKYAHTGELYMQVTNAGLRTMPHTFYLYFNHRRIDTVSIRGEPPYLDLMVNGEHKDTCSNCIDFAYKGRLFFLD